MAGRPLMKGRIVCAAVAISACTPGVSTTPVVKPVVVDASFDAGMSRDAEPDRVATDGGVDIALVDEATADRRVFRSLHVGMLDPASRGDWTLVRGATRARLEVAAQTAKAIWIDQLDGKENQESLWVAAKTTVYLGSIDGMALHFTRVCTELPKSACRVIPSEAPERLDLECKPARVEVLAAGTALVRAGVSNGVGINRWSPRAREHVDVLQCAVAGNSPLPWTPDLMFAAARPTSPGVEWAFVNNDMVAQEGAYRWMP